MLKIGLSKSIIQYSYIGFACLSINQFYKFLSSYKLHPANVARFNKFFYRNLRGGYDDSDSSFKNLLENQKQESVETKEEPVETKQEVIQAKTDKYIVVITQNNTKFKILQDLVFGLRFTKYIISQITQEIIAFLHVTFDYTYLFLENKQVSGLLTTISFYFQSKQLIFLLRCFNGLAVAGPFAAFTMVISISSQSIFIILQLKMMIDFSDFKDPKIRDMNEWLLITRNPIPLLGYYLPKALLEMAFDTTVQNLLKFHLGENHNTVSKILVNNIQNLFLTLKKLK